MRRELFGSAIAFADDLLTQAKLPATVAPEQNKKNASFLNYR
jgi:hypothetical protein